ncbi:UNVERIFIED_CONTAM: hypothetical protein FKN15_007557 [Acipenser sinensis]
MAADGGAVEQGVHVGKKKKVDPFPGPAPVPKERRQKFERGQKNEVRSLSKGRLKDRLSKTEEKIDLALNQAARSDLLLAEEAGHLLLGGRLGHVASLDWQSKQLQSEMNVMESVNDVRRVLEGETERRAGGAVDDVLDVLLYKCVRVLLTDLLSSPLRWLHSENMFAVAQRKWLYIYDNQGVELHCVKKFNDVLRMEHLLLGGRLGHVASLDWQSKQLQSEMNVMESVNDVRRVLEGETERRAGGAVDDVLDVLLHLLLGGRLGHVASLDWQSKQLQSEMNVMESVNDVRRVLEGETERHLLSSPLRWLHSENMFAVAQRKWLYIYDNQGVELHCVKKFNDVLRMEFLPYHFLLATAVHGDVGAGQEDEGVRYPILQTTRLVPASCRSNQHDHESERTAGNMLRRHCAGEERRGEERRGEQRRGEQSTGEERRWGRRGDGEERRGGRRREGDGEDKRGEESTGEERRAQERRGEHRRGEESRAQERGTERRGEGDGEDERRREGDRGEREERRGGRRGEERGTETRGGRRGQERRGEHRRGGGWIGVERRAQERRGGWRSGEESTGEERGMEEWRGEHRRGEGDGGEERRAQERERLCVYKDVCSTPVSRPYMAHRAPGRVWGVQFCPYEDVLGIGHGDGFTSMLVPGAGEANFDALDSNPFRSVKQRQEWEVKALLDKIQPELITLQPSKLGELDTATYQQRHKERVERLRQLEQRSEQCNSLNSPREGSKSPCLLIYHTSTLEQGAGEANFDALDSNPFRSVKQRQEWEVKALLDKIQPELITLQPSKLGELDTATYQQRHKERVERLGFDPREKEKFEPKLKMKGRSSTGSVQRRKKKIKNEDQRELIKQSLEMKDRADKERKKEEKMTSLGQRSALERFQK